MEETPHLVTHFMAVGAEKRLEDYHFLRNTYETITAQEIQLNRILRMLGEDEISLNWRLDLSPIGRARSRSPYDFDRWANALVLKGSIAYERLREIEQDTSKGTKPTTIPSSSRRIQDMRERRQRLSEQRDYPSGASGTSSSSRLRALAEYETSLTESNAKRQRQAEENRLNTSKSEDIEIPERKREKFRTTFADDEKSYGKTKQQEDESNYRSTKKTSLYEDQENDSNKIRKSSIKYGSDKPGDIELIAFSVRYQVIPSSSTEEGEDNPSIRLLCQWASPSSSPAIDYLTIERQLGNNEWLPIGEKIAKSENRTQLDIPSSNENNNNEAINPNIPSYFRLKAHLQNGQTFTSKPTDGIVIDLAREKKIIIPDVEILSPSSVQLTWNDNENEDNKNKNVKIKNEDVEDGENKYEHGENGENEYEDGENGKIKYENGENKNEDENNGENRNEHGESEENKNEDDEEKEKSNTYDTKKKEKSNTYDTEKKEESNTYDTEKKEKSIMYDIEKKEDQQEEWEKVTEVPLSQHSATIDSLTDAKQCQFRLIPTVSEPEEITKASTINTAISSENQAVFDEPTTPSAIDTVISSKNQTALEEPATPSAINTVISSKNQALLDEPATPSAIDTVISSKNQTALEEPTISKDEAESEETIQPEDEAETEVLTVNNVNEWLSSLHIEPTSSNTVDVDIAEEGFKVFDSYKVEYTTADRLDKWKQVSDITHDDPHLTIDNLKQETDYKFRFTPVKSDTAATDETNSSQLSLILDVKTPSTRKGRFTKDEDETPVAAPPQFSIQKLDPSTVLIEAVVPEDEPATFEDVYDVYSKKETKDDDADNDDNDWSKVGTIDKEHLSTTIENLEENTAYAFKIDNITSPSTDQESNTVQELKFDTTPVKQFDPSLFLEKIEQSLENVVNGVMQAAAGHQTLEEPVNKSLNEVIKEIFRDESLVPNEEYGFDTLALNNDLQVYRGPKQMMLKDLEIDETINSSKNYGEIIIHNYRTSQQSVIVREENGNTRVANIDGDIIIRNVVSDVLLKNEQTNHQLSMNIVGQAFLKGVQGSLIASKFKGIIVVKNVNKP